MSPAAPLGAWRAGESSNTRPLGHTGRLGRVSAAMAVARPKRLPPHHPFLFGGWRPLRSSVHALGDHGGNCSAAVRGAAWFGEANQEPQKGTLNRMDCVSQRHADAKTTRATMRPLWSQLRTISGPQRGMHDNRVIRLHRPCQRINSSRSLRRRATGRSQQESFSNPSSVCLLLGGPRPEENHFRCSARAYPRRCGDRAVLGERSIPRLARC